MQTPLIDGADGDRVVPLSFRTRIRRITIYDNGKGVVVETVDRKLKRFTAEQLIVRAKASA
jgi:transposase